MAIFYLDGFSFTGAALDGETPENFRPNRIVLGADSLDATLTYTLQPETWTSAELPLVDLAVPGFTAAASGGALLNPDGDSGGDIEVSIFRATLGEPDFAEPVEVDFLLIFNPANGTNTLVKIGGPVIPNPTTEAEFLSRLASFESAAPIPPGDPLAPGTAIPLSSFQNTTTSEGAFLIANEPFTRLDGTEFGDILVGAQGPNEIFGGAGDDFINPRNSMGGGTLIVPGSGSNTVDFNGSQQGFFQLDYSDRPAGIAVTIDGDTNSASIAKAGDGTDTLFGITGMLERGWAGSATLTIRGTEHDDSHVLNLLPGNWISVMGTDGTNSYTITGGGALRLDFREGTEGASVDLNTGTILNGGFGNEGTISGALFEIAGTEFDDLILGGGGNISVIPWGGNNVMDGGGGVNRLRFDQGEVRGLVVDLGGGGAIGTLNGVAFGHGFGNFQNVRSSQFGGVIIGSDANNRLEGRGGDDVLISGTGDDLLIGGPGRTIYVITPGGNATIQNFNPMLDVLVLAPLGLTEEESDALEITPSGNGSFIDFGERGTLLIQNIAPDDLDLMTVYPGYPDDLLRSPIIGTMGNDELFGTTGDDYINPRDNTDFDFIAPNIGENVIDFSEAENGFFILNYSGLPYSDGTGITALINPENGMVIRRPGDGSDQLLEVGRAMSADGLDLRGTGADDSFVIHTEAGQWVNITGGAGVDTYALSGEGIFRIDFQPGTEGAIVNLATGVIENDGFGNAEVLPAGLVRHVRGTVAGDDVLIGNALDNVLIPLGGNVTLDGGGGTNLVRYDQGNVTGLNVDLATGVATGAAGFGDPVAFTHTLSNIQNVRGSQTGDVLVAGAGDHVLDGRGGDDVLVSGAGGTDTLIGGAGADRFVITPLGQVIIADFNIAEDILDLSEMGLSESEVSSILASATEHGGNLLIDFGDPALGNLTMQGLGLADLAGMEIIGTGGGVPPEPGITRTGSWFENVPGGIYDYGIDAPGSLTVEGGAEFLMTTGFRGPTSIIGFRDGGLGEVVVTGEGSRIAMIEGSDPADVMGLMVGREGGQGQLVIENGARFEMLGEGESLDYGYVRVGGHDSIGQIVVRDGATFLLDREAGGNDLDFGFDNGQGTLLLSEGGRFEVVSRTFTNFDIGRSGGNGRLDITSDAELIIEANGPTGTAWLLSGTEGGTGLITMDEGAVIGIYGGQAAGLRLAQRWDHTTETSGSARMEMDGGSLVTIGGGNVSQLLIGGRNGSEGELNMRGGSEIALSSGLGIMMVGGVQPSADPEEGGEGLLTMTGAGTAISGVQQLYVGWNTGEGQMTLSDGARVDVARSSPEDASFVVVGGGRSADPRYGAGELILTGADTAMSLSGAETRLLVGLNLGEGRVILSDGASITIDGDDVFVAVGRGGGMGVIDLVGAGTELSVTGDGAEVRLVDDDADGSGIIILRDGSLLSAGDRIVVGSDDPADGTAMAGLVLAGGTAQAGEMLFHTGSLLGSGQLVDTDGGGFVQMTNGFLRVGDSVNESYAGVSGIGTLEITGDFAKTGGEAIFDIGAGGHDLLDVTGAISLDGTTLIVDWNAPAPDPAGSAHLLMRASGGIGGVDSLTLESNLDAADNPRLELRNGGEELWFVTSSVLDLSGTVNTRTGAPMEGVAVSFTSAIGGEFSQPSDEGGAFLFELAPGSAGILDASLAYDGSAHPAITSASALNVLRMALGRALPGRETTGEDFIAADFDGNGQVTSADALEILRVALGRPTASGEAPRWVFLDSAEDLSGLDRFDAGYTPGISVPAMSGDVTGLGLTGILVGHVPETLI